MHIFMIQWFLGRLLFLIFIDNILNFYINKVTIKGYQIIRNNNLNIASLIANNSVHNVSIIINPTRTIAIIPGEFISNKK